jgi:hypothetical protein
MPQVQSPDTAEGLGCGRIRVYMSTQYAVRESKAHMADVPSGGTGLLVWHTHGGSAAMPVYNVDIGLVSLIGRLLAHEKHAAEELGQSAEKRDPDGGAALAELKANINRGRDKLAAEKKAALARGEEWR